MTDIPLNEKGEELARKTGEGLKDVLFDLIYTSPLQRAVKTALLVRGERDIPVIKDERLRELCFGQYEGMIYKGDGFNIPDEKFPDFFRAPEQYRTPPEAESLKELLARTGGFLEELKNREDLKEKTILISSHGAAVRALLSNVERCELSQFWGNGVHKNCGVSCVELKDGEYRVLRENRTYY